MSSLKGHQDKGRRLVYRATGHLTDGRSIQLTAFAAAEHDAPLRAVFRVGALSEQPDEHATYIHGILHRADGNRSTTTLSTIVGWQKANGKPFHADVLTLRSHGDVLEGALLPRKAAALVKALHERSGSEEAIERLNHVFGVGAQLRIRFNARAAVEDAAAQTGALRHQSLVSL